MRLVCFSDTHKLHEAITIPDGDVLIFAGDMCGSGSLKSIKRFNDWLASFPHVHKIIVAGNHDTTLDGSLAKLSRDALTSCTYLQDTYVEIDGKIFYGSPWQPIFMSWAFNLMRGKQLERKWSFIHEDTDVLITHCPPYNTMDLVDNEYSAENGEHVGCMDLATRIKMLKKLKVHIFGHIHCGYGEVYKDGVHYINASVCNEDYEPVNPPIVIDI